MLTHRGQQVYQAFKLLFICQYLQALCLYQENLIEEEAEAKGKTASRAKNSDLGFYIEGGTTENWRCIEENREVFSGLAPEFPVRKNDAVSKQYIYGNGIDDIVRMDVFSGSTGTPYYFHQDHIGNVTAITDGSGNVVERVSYDLYGKPTFTDGSGSALTQSSIGNTLLFQSREYDGETSLYHFRARAYDPFMGRFLQTDPMGYADSMNLYQAFNMNPFNFTDPMGEETYRIFFGFRQNERGTNTRNQPVNFPNYNNLAPLAGPGDTFEFIPIGDPRYNVQNIQNSLNANDTQTYFIGHGARAHGSTQHITLGVDPSNRVFFPTNPVTSQNSRVGLFTCGSSQYSNTLVDGRPQLVSVDSGASNTSSTNALSESGYNYIRNRMRSDNPRNNQDRQITEQTIENRANQPFISSRYSKVDQSGQRIRIDQGDHVQKEPTQMQIQAMRTIGIVTGLFRL